MSGGPPPSSSRPAGLRTLAVDLGARRVGLALSDEGGRFATPLDVLEINSPQMALEAVLARIAQEEPDRLVVGVPLDMDGGMGRAASSAIAWGRELGTRAGLPVIFVDERLSSFEAEQGLIERKRGGEHITRQKKKQRLDALAAASFLQAFLDGKTGAMEI